ncbi:putative signal transducing protein [Mariniflexile sp. HNIBRBA6329]|uniref:putative signal transducing protein n=1 Tax=Mariniflexile sp. HNIBRBA6329 TaxID=3373088 RepID=UPI0037457959
MNETFKTIARFQYSTEAQIIKGRLEAEGIKVFLSDHITIDTDPLVSNAIGGVKLKVLAHQAEEAELILESIKKYSVDDEGDKIVCPNCTNQEIKLYSTIKDVKSFVSFILGFVFGTLPFYTKHKYRCESCKTEFDLK